MIVEYVSHAYNNAFRFPVRFLSMVSGIALAAFTVLYLLSMMTVLQMHNDYAIQSITGQNVNYTQFTLSTKTLDRPVTPETTKSILSLKGAQKGYYYEDLSFNLWEYEYLAPWLEWDNKLLLEMQPILLDIAAAQDYGLGQKIVYGRYFSGDPNEIILSLDLFNRFVDKSRVLQNNTSVIPEEYRASLKKGNGIKLDPESLIGQTVPWVYSINFAAQFPQIESVNTVPLKVVGVFDPGIGYETQGNVWLPISLKTSLSKLDLTSRPAGAGGKLAVSIRDDAFARDFTKNADSQGYFINRSFQLESRDQARLAELKAEQSFYSYAYATAVVISLASFIVILFLVISGRKYEWILQRALGLTRRKLVVLFALEMFIVSSIGALFGLLLTLALLNSEISFLFGKQSYLPGDVTILVIGGIPVTVTILSYALIRRASRSTISTELAKGE